MAELEAAIANYRWAMEQLSQDLNTTTILRLFYARDQICELLQMTPKTLVPHQTELLALDLALRDYAWRIVEIVNLPQMRRSFNPSDQAWWWFLDQDLPPHKWDRFDWLWQSLTVSGWTINLALLGDIASRFVMGGIGVGGATAVILPTILTGLKARSDLQEKGQDVIKFVFEKFGVKSHFREEAKLISTVALLVIFGGFWLSLPSISRLYNYLGDRSLKVGEIEEAKNNFKRAIALNSNNTKAHYNLGYIYEDLQETEQAIAHYEVAVAQSFPAANNSLARLYLLADRESEAIALLREGLAELDETQTDDPDLRYNLLKNLGWARYRQDATEEANKYLTAAEELVQTNATVVTNAAASYCLHALNLEDAGQPEQAIAKWQKCCEIGSVDNPDEDQWLIKAAVALEAVGQTCNVDQSLPYSPDYPGATSSL